MAFPTVFFSIHLSHFFIKTGKARKIKGVIRVFGIAQITPFCIYQISPFLCLLDDVGQVKPV